MSRKKRILWVGETSHAASGFGTYSKEILTRLAASGKYELAEFASYACVGDNRDNDNNWMVYPNAVAPHDSRYAEYKSKPTNQFGEWRFERVSLDFHPDIVCDSRDPWCFSFQVNSPLRPYYHHVIMPTVDSAPQKSEWLDMFMKADGVFVYSDWAIDVLRNESGGKIKVQQAAYPGVDGKIFTPLKNSEEKEVHKQRMGLPKDSYVIGMVGRNQPRKLYPDLFHAFRLFLDRAPKDLAEKTYLYVHTSYPDRGWDIPELLQEFGLGSKVFFTYICRTTHQPYCIPFQGARTYSPISNSITGTMPSVAFGLDREQLADIYNCFDLYIQYANCGGFEMPLVEAAACGIPIAAVNYSAMTDTVKNTGGIPLKVQRMTRELELGAYRALPDNEYTAKAIEKFLLLPFATKEKMGKKARKIAETLYNWDRTAQIWMDYFDSIQLKNKQGYWSAPKVLWNVPKDIPNGLSNSAFVQWLYHAVINEPEHEYSYNALTILKDLNYGVCLINGEMQQVSRTDIFGQFRNYAQNKQICEDGRFAQLDIPDYVRYAHLKI